MRPLLATVALALLAQGALACARTAGRAGVSGADRAELGAQRALAGERSGERRLAPGYDSEDSAVLRFGLAARGADASRITALVERYYAAGARGDGAAACALTSPSFAATVPADYGQELGWAIPPGAQAYLRGANSCAAVLSLLFEHQREQLAAPVVVTGVRLRGDHGYAVVDSTTLPASFVEVARERGGWRIDGLLGRPLP
jgi:ketosteroid isomerase-like protein